MSFNRHSDLEGKHAFLGASKYSWLNYSPDKLREVYMNELAKERGTILHEFASQAIKLRIKLAGKSTIALFVNDSISDDMASEIVLRYSDNCFGTADAISCKMERRRNELGKFSKNEVLRIYDLKTGSTKASEKQLLIYAALYCLEYGKDPTKLLIELRLYQYDTASIYIPVPEEIREIMDLIVEFDDIIEDIKRRYLYNVYNL